MKADVYLGTNLIRNCDAALIVNGTEVFRLRERAGDGRLLVDFDVRDQKGNRIAKVANNNVVHVADGFEAINRARESLVQEKGTGRVVAKAEELAGAVIRITGEFWVDGFSLLIGPEVMTVGGLSMSGNIMDGCGQGIVVSNAGIGLGGA